MNQLPKPHISKTDVFHEVRAYLMISIGLLMYAFAWTALLIPAKMVGGGTGGLGTIIYYATSDAAGQGGIPVGVTYLVANIILLIFGFWIIGPRFGAKTIYAIIFTSVVLTIFQEKIPPDLVGLENDKLLSAILGGGLAGVGIGMCFSVGGSSGGTDIIAMIINKYRNISYGKVIMFCDFIIIGCSYFIGNGISTVIYSYVIVAVSGYMLDTVLAGNRQSSQILIVSKNYKAIAEHISTELKRGVTLIDGEGWYTKEPIKIVMVVCRKNETSSLFRIIKEFDSQAFITVGSVMGVYGLGFEALKK